MANGALVQRVIATSGQRRRRRRPMPTSRSPARRRRWPEGGSVLTPIDATKAPSIGYWVLDTPPAGYTLEGPLQVLGASARGRLRRPDRVDDDHHDDARDAAEDERQLHRRLHERDQHDPHPAGCRPASQPQSDATDVQTTATVGNLGSSKIAVGIIGSTVVAQPTGTPGWFVQATGTVPLATLQAAVGPMHATTGLCPPPSLPPLQASGHFTGSEQRRSDPTVRRRASITARARACSRRLSCRPWPRSEGWRRLRPGWSTSCGPTGVDVVVALPDYDGTTLDGEDDVRPVAALVGRAGERAGRGASRGRRAAPRQRAGHRPPAPVPPARRHAAGPTTTSGSSASRWPSPSSGASSAPTSCTSTTGTPPAPWPRSTRARRAWCRSTTSPTRARPTGSGSTLSARGRRLRVVRRSQPAQGRPALADAIVAVSPHLRRGDPQPGGRLRARRRARAPGRRTRSSGIRNGIDTAVWDPADRPELPTPYDARPTSPARPRAGRRCSPALGLAGARRAPRRARHPAHRAEGHRPPACAGALPAAPAAAPRDPRRRRRRHRRRAARSGRRPPRAAGLRRGLRRRAQPPAVRRRRPPADAEPVRALRAQPRCRRCATARSRS